MRPGEDFGCDSHRDARRARAGAAPPLFRNHNERPAETCRSPFALNGVRRCRQKPRRDT